MLHLIDIPGLNIQPVCDRHLCGLHIRMIKNLFVAKITGNLFFSITFGSGNSAGQELIISTCMAQRNVDIFPIFFIDPVQVAYIGQKQQNLAGQAV